MFRLLSLLGALSLATDLGSGSPLDESLRRSVVAGRLATAVGRSRDEVADVLYASLLQHLGCTAYAHENGQRWRDDTAFVRLAFGTDFSDNREVWRTFVPALAESSGRSRLGVAATALTTGRKDSRLGPRATCEVTRQAAGRLGLSDTVRVALAHALTEWNGKGYPATRQDEIPEVARLMHVAAVAVLTDADQGRAAVVPELRRRSGTMLDPALVATFVEQVEDLLGTDVGDPFDLALDSEPDPVRWIDEVGTREVARTFGDLADLKSPWFQGHSQAVADLAAAAAAGLGLDAAEVETVRIAGHLHDLGRIGTPSSVWDKTDRLTRSELEQTRLHPQLSERILTRVPALAGAATLAGQHHERLDGSGYFRGLGSAQLPIASRVLATADAYRELVEDRPYRLGIGAARAAERLRAGVRSGGLDGEVVEAVLQAAGHASGTRHPRPAGLTGRQVEVLRLLAAGLSNRQIAGRLSISHRTAEHHVQDTYSRIGCSTRAGAALFAMEHGLLDKDG